MNPDINGAVNTGRKYDERIFPKDMNTAYLYGNVKALRYTDILNESHNWHKKEKYCRSNGMMARERLMPVFRTRHGSFPLLTRQG